jgi:hypothetical protein
MKAAGLYEVDNLLARVRRLHALRRISSKDKGFIELRLEQIRERIIEMHELGEDGKEASYAAPAESNSRGPA